MATMAGMLLIDALNVLGARPDGWWRDRTGALVRLVDDIAAWRPDDVVVQAVIDGFPRPELPEGLRHGITVRYARRDGPDGADDAIVESVAAADVPTAVRVVTSDARLRARAVALGATVEGAGTFRARLETAG
jgi:predicted RNA-binding protein with PIN domain